MTDHLSVTGAHHLALKVRSLEAMLVFYKDQLGLRELRRFHFENGQLRCGELRSVWLGCGELILMLELSEQGGHIGLEHADAPLGDPPGYHLLALRIPASQREDWRHQLALQGILPYQESLYTLYVRDPEGNRVALSHFPDPA